MRMKFPGGEQHNTEYHQSFLFVYQRGREGLHGHSYHSQMLALLLSLTLVLLYISILILSL